MAAACRRKGFLTTAIVYGLGGRFFTREFYRAQGELAARKPGTGGCISLSFDVDYPEDAESLPEVCEFLERLGLKALKDVAAIVKPEPILSWYRKLVAKKFDGSAERGKSGRPRIGKESGSLRAPHGRGESNLGI